MFILPPEASMVDPPGLKLNCSHVLLCTHSYVALRRTCRTRSHAEDSCYACSYPYIYIDIDHLTVLHNRFERQSFVS
jgi:hypothetical protein